jgi:hypothetical protein
MKIENVSKGICENCENKATKKLDGIHYCSTCADNKLIKQIGRCIEAVEHAIVTIKILPKAAILKEKSRYGK